MKKYNYKILKNKSIVKNNFSLSSIDFKTIMKIRKWRNNQIDILRQSKKITLEEQENYFTQIIKKESLKIHPINILLSFFYKKKLIGYGGVTNICWISKRGELAFLLDDKYAGKMIDSEYFFPIFLDLVKILTFKILNLKSLWSETFSIRPRYIRQLELNNFIPIGKINNKIFINGNYYDNYFHSFQIKNKKKTINDNFFHESKFGNILVTSSSKKIPLIKKIYDSIFYIDNKIKLIAADKNKNVLSKTYTDFFWEMPTPINVNKFIILKNIEKLNIKVIIPTRDEELLFWSKNKIFFKKKGINIIINNYSKILLCNDKIKFNNFCVINSIKTPKLINVFSKTKKKIIIKEKYGSSNKIKIIDNFKNINQNFSKFKNPILQKYIQGTEISVDVWVDKSSKNKYFISRKRDLIINGESQITSNYKSKKLDIVIKNIIDHIKLKGPFMMQLIKNKNEYFLIECNARIGGASTFSIKNGLEMIYWSLIELYKINKYHEIKFINNNLYSKQIRVPNDNYEKNYNI